MRNINTLEKHGVVTVADLATKTREELLTIKNFGERSLNECAALLESLQVSHPDWSRPKRVLRKRRSAKRG